MPPIRALSELRLEPLSDRCLICEQKLWVAYHNTRTVATLSGLVQLRLVVRRCLKRDCELYQHSRRPEQEGAFALPLGEFGLDVIALIGALRHAEHRSVPEIHRELSGGGLAVSERDGNQSARSLRGVGGTQAVGPPRAAGEAQGAR